MLEELVKIIWVRHSGFKATLGFRCGLGLVRLGNQENVASNYR